MLVSPATSPNFGCKRVSNPDGSTAVVANHSGCKGAACPAKGLLENLLGRGGEPKVVVDAKTPTSPSQSKIPTLSVLA